MPPAPHWLRPELVWFWNQADTPLLARLIWGEAEGQHYVGKFGVGCVARNRVIKPMWWGTDFHTVILCTSQFSCFNAGSTRLRGMRAGEYGDTPAWNDAFKAARAILAGERDITDSADHYFNPHVVLPSWIDSMVRTVRIEDHDYYRAF